jgi:hypothetical protein
MQINQWIVQNKIYKLNPEWLKHQKTLKRIDPWDLKYETEDSRYWLGGFFDETGEWIYPVVTLEKKIKGKWFQIEQYNREGKL